MDTYWVVLCYTAAPHSVDSWFAPWPAGHSTVWSKKNGLIMQSCKKKKLCSFFSRREMKMKWMKRSGIRPYSLQDVHAAACQWEQKWNICFVCHGNCFIEILILFFLRICAKNEIFMCMWTFWLTPVSAQEAVPPNKDTFIYLFIFYDNGCCILVKKKSDSFYAPPGSFLLHLTPK